MTTIFSIKKWTDKTLQLRTEEIISSNKSRVREEIITHAEALQLLNALQQSMHQTACAECGQPYPNHSHSCQQAGQA